MSVNRFDNFNQNYDSNLIEIFHLYHSGVALIVNNSLIVFDYYNDKPDNSERSLRSGVISKNELKKFSKIYVFVSHRHSDHYNPIIYKWAKENSNIKYILSTDIQCNTESFGILGEKIFYIDKDSFLQIDSLEIETYGSTDQGVSFLLKLNNINIFHAGDLNWWHWKSFSRDELKREEEGFKKEVDKLKNKDIKIAFVPVDPRLEEYYYLAGEYFINTLRPSVFIPIHFADNYKITEEFANRLFRLSTEIAVIKKRGERININRIDDKN